MGISTSFNLEMNDDMKHAIRTSVGSTVDIGTYDDEGRLLPEKEWRSKLTETFPPKACSGVYRAWREALVASQRDPSLGTIALLNDTKLRFVGCSLRAAIEKEEE